MRNEMRQGAVEGRRYLKVRGGGGGEGKNYTCGLDTWGRMSLSGNGKRLGKVQGE